MSRKKLTEIPDGVTPFRRLAWAIKDAGYSIGEAAGLMRISEDHLSAVINGRHTLTKKLLHSAQEALRIQMLWVMSGIGPYRTQEDGPQYVLGPMSAPASGTVAAPVIARQTWQCGYCYAEVRQYAETCHRCGSRIDWSNQVESALPESQKDKGEER